MALQDILDAIIKDADKRIASAHSVHSQRMKTMREESERKIARCRQQIIDQKNLKISHIREKALSQARISKSRSILMKKQEQMDLLYGTVMKKLVSLPRAETETFLRFCLAQIGHAGVIHPSCAHKEWIAPLLPKDMTLGTSIDGIGGFRFSSQREEHNFTYEFLVHGLLRPMTDVDAAHGLFFRS